MRYCLYCFLLPLVYACVGDYSQNQTTKNNESGIAGLMATNTVEHDMDSSENRLEAKADTRTDFSVTRKQIPVKVNDLIGINAFEWDFLQNPNDRNEIEKI